MTIICVLSIFYYISHTYKRRLLIVFCIPYGLWYDRKPLERKRKSNSQEGQNCINERLTIKSIRELLITEYSWISKPEYRLDNGNVVHVTQWDITTHSWLNFNGGSMKKSGWVCSYNRCSIYATFLHIIYTIQHTPIWPINVSMTLYIYVYLQHTCTGWLLKSQNLTTAPGSVGDEVGSITWLATRRLKKSTLSLREIILKY